MIKLDKKDIINLLPHREPMLLIDELFDIKKLNSAIALVKVRKNSFFVQGHFPENPVMPGVLIVESMAQTSGALVVSSFGKEAMGKLVYFMSIDKARFRQMVVPGDQLFIEVKKKQARKLVWKFDCLAKVDDKIVAEATITAMIADSND